MITRLRNGSRVRLTKTVDFRSPLLGRGPLLKKGIIGTVTHGTSDREVVWVHWDTPDYIGRMPIRFLEPMKPTVTFKKSGEITWVSKSGRTERRAYVAKGQSLDCKVVPSEDCVDAIGPTHYDLKDGNWTVFGIPADAVKVS